MKELEQAKLEGFHDITFVNDDLQATFDALEKYIFGPEDVKDEPSGEGAKVPLGPGSTEVEMTDGAPAVEVDAKAPAGEESLAMET
jgi:hypothetical protein